MSQEKKATIKENTEKAKSSDSKKNKKNTPIQDEKLPLKTDIDTTTKEDDKPERRTSKTKEEIWWQFDLTKAGFHSLAFPYELLGS